MSLEKKIQKESVLGRFTKTLLAVSLAIASVYSLSCGGKPTSNSKVSRSIENVNLADYIFVPKYNISVAKQTSLHGLNWYQAHEELHRLGARMLVLREFLNFFKLLRSNSAEDGLGNRLSKEETLSLYNEITEERAPQRGEWLDAYFDFDRLSNGDFQTKINYNHRIIDGELKAQNSEQLIDCLKEDCYIDISEYCSSQGMPVVKSRKEEIRYFPYKYGCATWFEAEAGLVRLACDRDPRSRSESIGVRAVYDRR